MEVESRRLASTACWVGYVYSLPICVFIVPHRCVWSRLRCMTCICFCDLGFLHSRIMRSHPVMRDICDQRTFAVFHVQIPSDTLPNVHRVLYELVRFLLLICDDSSAGKYSIGPCDGKRRTARTWYVPVHVTSSTLLFRAVAVVVTSMVVDVD